MYMSFPRTNYILTTIVEKKTQFYEQHIFIYIEFEKHF